MVAVHLSSPYFGAPIAGLGPSWGASGQILFACVWWAFFSAAGSRAQDLTCRPQDGLALDAPYQRPQYLASGLPLCHQYDCSCCNRSHAMALFRGVRAANDDESFSRRCVEFLTTMACRVCDPEVGVGLKPTVCSSKCDDWYAACRDDYFGFDPRTDRLAPCDGAAGRMLVCSQLSQLAADGAQLCRTAGYLVSEGPNSEDQPCFDGVKPKRPDLCVRPPPSSSRRRARQTVGGYPGKELVDAVAATPAALVMLGVATVYGVRAAVPRALALLGSAAAALQRAVRGTGAYGRPQYAR